MPTVATRDWLETNFTIKLLAAARIVDPDTSWVWIETEARGANIPFMLELPLSGGP